MTDTDISEMINAKALVVINQKMSFLMDAVHCLSARLDALEAAKAMQQGAVGNAGYSDVSVVFAAPPNAPGLDTHDSGRVKYGAGMITY